MTDSELIPKKISQKLNLPLNSVMKTISLIEDGSTIPFIARYRKEATQSLDEVAIANIQNELDSLKELIKRRAYIIQTVKDQGQLSHQLKQKLENCWDETLLEDLYLPFKKKRKTKASIAKEHGLEPLAKLIWNQQNQQIKKEAKKFLKTSITTVEQALEGARNIISERINEDADARNIIRSIFQREAMLKSKVIKDKKEEASKYKDYFDYNEPIQRAPAHRILAILRAEKDGLLRVNLTIEKEQALFRLGKVFIRPSGNFTCKEQMQLTIEDTYKRLLFTSIETEFRKIYKEKADVDAISVFSNNLSQLLLSAPLGNKKTMGIDPGFRTGCKVVCLDESGGLLCDAVIYPHPPQNLTDEAANSISRLIEKYQIEAVAIGNGTAGKETYSFLKNCGIDKHADLYMVNESGASIYSASEVARNEFPDLDLTVRGAISIARRLMDPLNWLRLILNL